MQRLQAFKYELMPTGGQRHAMRCFAGSCRFVFNKALALQKAPRKARRNWVTRVCASCSPHGVAVRKLKWLAAAPAHPLQPALKDLERAHANFFAKRADFPRFKKKGRKDSFRYPDPNRSDQTRPRQFPHLPAQARLDTLPQQPRNSRGIDMGIARFATFSDSSFLEPLASFKRHEIRLRSYQRVMSRRRNLVTEPLNNS